MKSASFCDSLTETRVFFEINFTESPDMKTENGLPFTHVDTPTGRLPVNAVDALALLSGVNFGSVEKVITAINLVMKYHGNPVLQHLFLMDSMPAERVRVNDPTQDARIYATYLYCRRLSEDLHVGDVGPLAEELTRIRGRLAR